MIEIFLIWTLVAGEPYDVDSFKNEQDCITSLAVAEENFQRMRDAKPELSKVTLSGCHKVNVPEPVRSLLDRVHPRS